LVLLVVLVVVVLLIFLFLLLIVVVVVVVFLIILILLIIAIVCRQMAARIARVVVAGNCRSECPAELLMATGKLSTAAQVKKEEVHVLLYHFLVFPFVTLLCAFFVLLFC
jgi:hypothetical protein